MPQVPGTSVEHQLRTALNTMRDRAEKAEAIVKTVEEGHNALRKLICHQISMELSRLEVDTPKEGYGENTSAAISDMSREIKRLKDKVFDLGNEAANAGIERSLQD